MVDQSARVGSLGARIAKHIKSAQEHEAQAIKHRQQAAALAEKLRQLVAPAQSGEGGGRRRHAKQESVSPNATRIDRADQNAANTLRQWALAKGSDFSFSEA